MYKSKLVQFKELVIRVDSMVDQLTIQIFLQSLKSHRKTTRSWLLSPEQGKVLLSCWASTSRQRRIKTRRHKIPLSPPPSPPNRLMRNRQASARNKLASCDLGRLHFTSNFILHSDFASNNLFVFDLVQNHIQFFSGIKVV